MYVVTIYFKVCLLDCSEEPPRASTAFKGYSDMYSYMKMLFDLYPIKCYLIFIILEFC